MSSTFQTLTFYRWFNFMENFNSIFKNSICGSAETSCCINYHYMLHDIKVWTDKINKRYELFKML